MRSITKLGASSAERAGAIAPRFVRPVFALSLCAAALAACSDAPTGSTPFMDAPGRAALGKGGKPTEPAIALGVIDGGQNVFTLDVATMGFNQVTSGGLDDAPAWSPDRRKLAFVRGDGADRKIYARSVKGGRDQLLGPGFDPSWSPDGTQIVFAQWVNGNLDIYVMNTDGTNVRRLTTDPAGDFQPHWSENGEKIAFSSTRTVIPEIFVMNADGSNQTQRTACGPNNSCTMPKWAPIPGDDRIAYYAHYTGIPGTPPVVGIMVSDAAGVKSVDIQHETITGALTWSPDAQQVAFLARISGQPNPDIYVVYTNSAGFTRLTEVGGKTFSSLAWAR
jgi:Tol biopolymer transport system component